MPSTINNLATTYGDDYFFNESFLVLIRSYIPLILKQQLTQVSPTNQQLYKYQGDFYGLLDELGVEKQYHYATLLVNQLKSSTEFEPSMAVILLPNTAYIDMIHSVYTTTFTT